MRLASSVRPRPPSRDRSSILFFPDAQRLNPWARDHPDPLRIAIVGDSVTRGAGCQFFDTYGMKLEAFLNCNAGQRPAQVRIWAQGGMSTHDELVYLSEIVPWKPKLLILGICLNDTEDLQNKEILSRWRRETLPPTPSPAMARVLAYTRLGAWVYQQTGNRKARQGFLNYYRNLYDPSYSGWNLFVRAIRRFNETCREHEIGFVPVIFPLFSDVDRYPLEGVHRQIGDLFRAEGIPHLDLLNTFRGRSPLRLQAIPYVDAHPSEIAHRLAAEAIFQYLLANRHIDEGYLPVHSTTPPERMWQMMEKFIYDAAATKAADAEALKERGK